MKLYTEDEVRIIIKIAFWQDFENGTTEDDIIGFANPIELPSDDAIEAAALDTYREYPNNPKEHPEWTYNKDVNAPRKRRAFNIGAHWVINRIKQQRDIDAPLSKQQDNGMEINN